MLTVDQAVHLILARIGPLESESATLLDANGRVIGETVRARWNVPPFRNSAMDGFAVRWEDVAACTPDKPTSLEIADEVAAGYVSKKAVSPGRAIKIMTGAPLPKGADTIIRDEYTRDHGHQVAILKTDGKGGHIRQAGEDIARGQVIVHKGKILGPADIGLLASIGRPTVRVHRRPVAAIISTGDELVPVDQRPGPGKIVNSNSYTLSCAVAQVGAIPRSLGIVPDKRKSLTKAFETALKADVVIVSGGVSGGDYDFVKEALADAGVKMKFWQVAQRPGHPMAFGRAGRKPVFGLPGNPVSSVVSFVLYARPALLKMMGYQNVFLPVIRAILEHDIKTAPGLKEFVRCRLEKKDGGFLASSTGTQGAGVLRSLSLAQGLIVSQEHQTVLPKGSEAPVILLNGHDTAHQAEMGF